MTDQPSIQPIAPVQLKVSGKTLALTSTILTGVAVVSASIGAIRYFTGKPSSQEAARPAPRFNVGLGVAPGGAAAAASWRF